MDIAYSNITYIILDGFVGLEKYRYAYFFILLAVYILIICSNSVIVYLIWTHQNLHEPMYVFIAALSLNSVLFSTTIYPKLLTDVLSESQVVSHSACMFQCFIYYSLGGSDFLLLAAMAYDRYVSICKPLQHPTIMTKTSVSVFLGLAWFVPSCESAVAVVLTATKKLCTVTMKATFCDNSFHKLYCERSTSLIIYDMFIMLNVVIAPVIFILFTYTRIFILLYSSCIDVRNKAAETCLPHLLVLMVFSILCVYNVIKAQPEFEFSKLVRLIMTLQVVIYNPLLNPIIYGLKVKEISKHLKNLLCYDKNNFSAEII